jgi:hypothetical protein
MIPPDTSTNDDVAHFFMTLLHAATTGHILHLQTKSFSEHMALNTFYSELPELVDQVIEAYQGKYGIVTNYPEGYLPYDGTPLEYVSILSDYFKGARANIGSDSELQNLCDEIQQLFDSIIYKLRFLK